MEAVMMDEAREAFEKDEATPATSEVKETQTTATETAVEEEKQPEAPQEGAETSPVSEEPTFELDGQRLTATQLKEYKEAYENREKWQRTNTERAQEVARQRKEVEEALLLRNLVTQKPELLQRILIPEPARDFDAELRTHYGQRPIDPYSQEYANWEYQKDILLQARASTIAEERSRAESTRVAAEQHNVSVSNKAWEKYKDKVTPEDYTRMANWIVSNVKDNAGKYPDYAFDLAFGAIFPDKTIREAKLETSRKTAESLTKAKPASDETGVNKSQHRKTASDAEDEEFSTRVTSRKGH